MFRRLDIPRLLAAITLVATFAMAARVPTSPDMWWHLRCGEVQWRTGSVLKADVFSHTAAGSAWINQSWLPQVIMYGLYAWGGFPALALAVAVLVPIAFAFVLLGMRPEGRYGHFWRALVVVWAAVSTGRTWAARPHLITLALTAVWVYILDRHRQGEREIGVLWWLPPLMLLWANSHGGHIVGLILLGMQIVGTVTHALWHRRLAGLWATIRPLAIITLCCVLVALVNPQGIRLLLFPFQTLSSSAQQNLISEWASPDFHATDLLPFLALLLAAWSALAFSGLEVEGVEWIRLLGFTAMALRSGRYLGLCAVVAAPVLFRYGQAGWARVSANWGSPPSRLPPSRGIPLANWVLLVAVLTAAVLKASLALGSETIDRVHSSLFPIDAVAYMRDHDLPAQVFNDYGWGGYLAWELYPGTPVFIDGRADPYGDDLIVAYRQVITAQRGWEEVLDRYQVHTALVGTNSALASVMQKGGGWQTVYGDEVATVLVRQ
jgi:hypothetical protein